MNGGFLARCVLCLALFACGTEPVRAAGNGTAYEVLEVPKQRVIVLTDITNEPDDQESMVRFLVYANEYDVEGLIATTSTWLRNRVSPETIRTQIDAFGEVRENLLKHADGYPSKDELLAVTATHLPVFGMEGVGAGKSPHS